MYLAHFNLTLKPFEENPDPRFFWLSEKHKEALASLKYGIQENKAFILINGDVGTGKTSLINYFLIDNDIDAIVANLPDPDLSIYDFFKLITNEFNISLDSNSKGDFLIQFEHFLQTTYSGRKRVLLIIDEAQRLNQQLIEQIRLLSNIERNYTKLINVFLVGQNEVIAIIKDEKNKPLRQRLTVHYTIEPLTEPETQEYIKHRLRVAGSQNGIFTHKAVHEIFSFSGGCPRLINIICDRALLTAYVRETKKITGEIIKQCTDELKILIE
ncbi:MAG: AAA family ATPase [Desulfobacterales bacterium]|jgi:general secretion pathway protein A